MECILWALLSFALIPHPSAPLLLIAAFSLTRIIDTKPCVTCLLLGCILLIASTSLSCVPGARPTSELLTGLNNVSASVGREGQPRIVQFGVFSYGSVPDDMECWIDTSLIDMRRFQLWMDDRLFEPYNKEEGYEEEAGLSPFQAFFKTLRGAFDTVNNPRALALA